MLPRLFADPICILYCSGFRAAVRRANNDAVRVLSNLSNIKMTIVTNCLLSKRPLHTAAAQKQE
jgi:hypothetical protein